MCEEPKSSDDGNATNTSIGIGYCSKVCERCVCVFDF